ncbi:exo-alpha-sialidase [Trypanosoma cruzi]|nr:exo-alpha-sialidase [Trypanosoma cruzi]
MNKYIRGANNEDLANPLSFHWLILLLRRILFVWKSLLSGQQPRQTFLPFLFLFACVPQARFDSSGIVASTQSHPSVAAFAEPMGLGIQSTHTHGRNKRDGAHPSPRRSPSLLSAATE